MKGPLHSMLLISQESCLVMFLLAENKINSISQVTG